MTIYKTEMVNTISDILSCGSYGDVLFFIAIRSNNKRSLVAP